MTPYLILERALAVLRERGRYRDALCPGTDFSAIVPVCPVGAVNVADHGTAHFGYPSDDCPALELLEYAACDVLSEEEIRWRGSCRLASYYNDKPRTTDADVEQLLMDAMSLALSEEANDAG
jgi:hypothetical protein